MKNSRFLCTSKLTSNAPINDTLSKYILRELSGIQNSIMQFTFARFSIKYHMYQNSSAVLLIYFHAETPPHLLLLNQILFNKKFLASRYAVIISFLNMTTPKSLHFIISISVYLRLEYFYCIWFLYLLRYQHLVFIPYWLLLDICDMDHRGCCVLFTIPLTSCDCHLSLCF